MRAHAVPMDVPVMLEEPLIRFRVGSRLVEMPLREARRVRLEDATPVRKFARYRGQRNVVGDAWVSKLRCHVPYESGLELDMVRLLDFDRGVARFAVQPFVLVYPAADGRVRRHVPDMFVRNSDGSARVVNCKPLGKPLDDAAGVFADVGRVFAGVGWGHDVFSGSSPVLRANVEWLWRFHRRLPGGFDGAVCLVVDGARHGVATFGELAGLVGNDPVGVTIVGHLLWSGKLVCPSIGSAVLRSSTALEVRW